MSAKAAKDRVVITGYGAVTAAGSNIDATWEAVKAGKTGIATISQWDVTGWDYQLGAEIKDYQPRKMIADRKLLKLLSRQDVIGLNAVKQALAHSELLTYRDSLTDAKLLNDRTGIFVGSPGNKYQQQYDFMPLFTQANGDMKKFAKGLFEQVHPMWLLRTLPNNVLAYTSIQYGFKGPNENITNHGVSGMQAIAQASRFLKAGTIDRAVVIGYDACIEPQALIYYGQLGTLSARAIRPFDKQRDGTILGEGAGALILETLAAAKQRGAKVYGEILGYATTSEAAGIFSVKKDGSGVTNVICKALREAQLKASDIGMITTHGNGTQLSDATEAKAISDIFQNHAVPATGFKWCFGHTVTAAGVIETLLTLLALKQAKVPGIQTLRQKATDCDALNVSQHTQPTLSSTGLVLSRAFSSLNSCLILSDL